MIFRLLLLFIIVPLLELGILLYLSSLIGWLETLAIVIVTGVVGTWLARRQGVQTLRRIQRELGQGQMPGDALLDALMIFLAGAFLMTPGVLTDALGFSLLIPASRRAMKAWVTAWFKRNFKIQTFAPPPPGSADDENVIDSYAIGRETDEDAP